MRIGLKHGDTGWPVPLVASFCAVFVAGALFGCAAQPSPGEESKDRRNELKCPTFTRPDTARLVGGVMVRACTDRHGNVVCVERGGQLRCRTGDGASLINEDGDW